MSALRMEEQLALRPLRTGVTWLPTIRPLLTLGLTFNETRNTPQKMNTLRVLSGR